MRFRRAALALLLAAAGSAAASATPARAGTADAADPCAAPAVTVTSFTDAPGQVERGDGHQFGVLVHVDAPYDAQNSDTVTITVDGQDADYTQDSDPDDGAQPGMPADAYTGSGGWDVAWLDLEPVMLTDGPHDVDVDVAEGPFCHTDANDTGNDLGTTELPIVVDEAPIGISLSPSGGQTVRGATLTPAVQLTPQGSPIASVDYRLDQTDFTGSASLLHVANGRHTLTVTATDQAGISTSSTTTFVVDNHRSIGLSAPRHVAAGKTATLSVTVGQVTASVPVLVQRWAGGKWHTVGPALRVGRSGHLRVPLRFATPGTRKLRVVTQDKAVLPGISATRVVTVG